MNLHKIIFATDFSSHSKAALEYASEIAAVEKAELLIAHVDDVTPGLVLGDLGYGYIPEIDEIARESYETLLKLRPAHSEVVYTHHFLRGSAANAILRLAAEQQADLIVIGTQGRSGMSRLLMGSVAEEIVRRASCPVMTVRRASSEEGESSSREGIAAAQQSHSFPNPQRRIRQPERLTPCNSFKTSLFPLTRDQTTTASLSKQRRSPGTAALP